MGLIKEGNSAVPNQPSGVNEVVQTYSNSQPLDAKSKRILAQGIVQATLQASVLQMFCTNWEEWIHLVKKTADEAIKLVEEKSK